MILDVAVLGVKPGQCQNFKLAFTKTQNITSSMLGYVFHQLQQCLEPPSRYILRVNWETLEGHETGFCDASDYQEWKALLHHFYDPFPVVEHYEFVFSGDVECN